MNDETDNRLNTFDKAKWFDLCLSSRDTLKGNRVENCVID